MTIRAIDRRFELAPWRLDERWPVQDRYIETFEVPCGGSIHRVTIDTHGPITLHDHCPSLIDTEIDLALACGDLDFERHDPPTNACVAIVEAWRRACYGRLAVPSTSWLPREALANLQGPGSQRATRRQETQSTWVDDLNRRKDALRCYSMARQISVAIGERALPAPPLAVGIAPSTPSLIRRQVSGGPALGPLGFRIPTRWSAALRVRHVRERQETYVWSANHDPGDPVIVLMGSLPFLDVRRAPYNPNGKPGPTDWQGSIRDSAPALIARHDWTPQSRYHYVPGEPFSSKNFRRDSDREDTDDDHQADTGAEALSP